MYGGKICGDYAGGWFLWALRDAVTLIGGYADAPTASEFYRKMTEEITRACNSKQIACRSSPLAEIPPLVPANYALMLESVGKTIKLISLVTPITAIRPRSEGPPAYVIVALRVLNRPIAAPHITDPQDAMFSGKAPRSAVVFVEQVQGLIRTLFNTVWPFVCAIGVLGILFSTYLRRAALTSDIPIIITWTFLTLVITRAALLSIVDATIHPGATMDYGNVAAYCLVVAVIMGIHLAAQDLLRLRKRRREANLVREFPEQRAS
jgi:hypothetical protein